LYFLAIIRWAEVCECSRTETLIIKLVFIKAIAFS